MKSTHYLSRSVKFIHNRFTNIKSLFQCLLLYRSIKLYIANDIKPSIWTLYKNKVKFPHPVGIVIGTSVRLGHNCTIYQNVTIGTKGDIKHKLAEYPSLGRNVTIYPNSIIIGGIEIGDNSRIGAGSVVLNNIPENSVAVGVPARVIRSNS